MGETIGKDTVTAKKLCTAFGILPPAFLEGAPDEAYHPLLAIAISREFSRRQKLPQYNTVEDAVRLLKESKNIVVLTGAGVSSLQKQRPCRKGHALTDFPRSPRAWAFRTFDRKTPVSIRSWSTSV